MLTWAASATVVFLTACHTRPDVKDVTNLNNVDIMRRIQCEAAFRVSDVYGQRGYAALNSLEEDFAKKRKAAIEDYSRIATEYQTEFATTPWEISEAKAALRVQILQQRTRIERLLDKSESDLIQADNALAQSLLAEADRLLSQSKRLDSVTDPPKKLLEAEIKVKQLAEEAKKFDELIKFESTTVVFEFLFSITEDNNATTDNSIAWPFALGTVSLKFAAGDKKKRFIEKTTKITATFDDLVKMIAKGQCNDIEYVSDAQLPLRYPIAGNIGMDKLIDGYLAALQTKLSYASSDDSFKDRIVFTTVIDGSLSPSASLNRRIGQTISLSAVVSLARTDAHQVTVFIKPGTKVKQDDPKPQEVIVRSLPEARTRILGPSTLD